MYSNPRIMSASSDVLMGRGRPGAHSSRSPGCGPTSPSLVQVVLTFGTFGTFSTYPHADFPNTCRLPEGDRSPFRVGAPM